MIKRSQKGASLIELVISVFIFSIGVLGFASLQSRSLQATFDNGQRDQVVWLTQSLVERIRVNSSTAAISQYVTTLTDFQSVDCPDPDPNPLCHAATCTDVEMAIFDTWELYCRNSFQGVDAIKSVSIDLICSDGTCDTATENLNLTTEWCSRGVEQTLASKSASCDNTIAQMSYSVGFRP